MNKVTILALLVLSYFAYNQYFTKPIKNNSSQARSVEQNKVIARKKVYSSNDFSCDGRQHCSQMTSRAEANFFIRNCPNTKMDGDNDGIPCERDSRW